MTGGTDHAPRGDATVPADALAVEPATRRALAETVREFPDVRFEERRVVAADEGDELVLVAEWTMRGTHAGSFDGLPPTGTEVALDGTDVVTVTDDGITSITGYFDQRAFAEQLRLTFPAVVGQLPTLAVGAVRRAISRQP